MDTITWGKTRTVISNINMNDLEYDDFIDYKNTLEPINSRESYV